MIDTIISSSFPVFAGTDRNAEQHAHADARTVISKNTFFAGHSNSIKVRNIITSFTSLEPNGPVTQKNVTPAFGKLLQ